MISDEERKIVAANLRQYLKKYETPDWRAFCNIILGSGRLDNLRKAQAFDRLADLIDRPTCHNASGCDDVFKCSECGAEFEPIAVNGNEYGDVFYTPLKPLYCSACGAEVVE